MANNTNFTDPATNPATDLTPNPQSPTESQRMCEVAQGALEDAKGAQIQRLDVRNLTDITDYMIVATGTSERHVKSLAEAVLSAMRAANWKPMGMEGEHDRDWVLVDFVDVVVHVMRADTREKYNLESLWDEALGEMLQSPRGDDFAESEGTDEPDSKAPQIAKPRRAAKRAVTTTEC